MKHDLIPRPPGRPRIFNEIAFLNVRVERRDLEELRQYARARAAREHRALSLRAVILAAVHESPRFRAFLASREGRAL